MTLQSPLPQPLTISGYMAEISFESISEVVDEIFSNYLSRPNVKAAHSHTVLRRTESNLPQLDEPVGIKEPGDQGYAAIEILRYYYGDSMYINTAEEISGIPSSWPGYSLDIGASGAKVEQIQEQLNAISNAYPLIPKIDADGIYGEDAGCS